MMRAMLLLLMRMMRMMMVVLTAAVVGVNVAAYTTHEHGDSDRQQHETRAAQCRHDHDPEQTSVCQVTEADCAWTSLG